MAGDVDVALRQVNAQRFPSSLWSAVILVRTVTPGGLLLILKTVLILRVL